MSGEGSSQVAESAPRESRLDKPLYQIPRQQHNPAIIRLPQKEKSPPMPITQTWMELQLGVLLTREDNEDEYCKGQVMVEWMIVQFVNGRNEIPKGTFRSVLLSRDDVVENKGITRETQMYICNRKRSEILNFMQGLRIEFEIMWEDVEQRFGLYEEVESMFGVAWRLDKDCIPSPEPELIR